MALIEMSGFEQLAVHSVSASHSSGELAPTFTVSIFPERGNEELFLVHRDWTPPESVTFTISGTEWKCSPGDAPRRISGNEGVSYSVQYIPDILYTLRYGKYKKNVAWISCPQWQADQYLANYDTDEWEVFHAESDVYPSNGFTIGAILEKLGNLIGISITSNLPTFHVAQVTVTLKKDQVLLGWIQSLLPSGFVYTWDWKGGALTVGLAVRAQTAITLPSLALDVDLDDPALVQYDRVVITGAPYKINFGGGSGGAWQDKYTLKQTYTPRFMATIEEELPAVEQVLNGENVSLVTTRLTKMGPDGTPFAVLTEDDEVTGAIYDYQGIYNSSGVIQRVARVFDYDNNDPIIYLKPRLTVLTETFSGYTTKVTPTEVSVSNGVVYHLIDDLRVLTRTQFLAESPAPTVIGSAYTTWVDDFQETVEEITYITTTDVTPDWPEGYELQRKKETTKVFYNVAGFYYPCTDSPRTILENIARQLQQESSPSLGTVLVEDKIFEGNSRKIALNTPGAYVYHDERTFYDQTSGRFRITRETAHINSTPPSSPTEYRVEPLELTSGNPTGNVVFATSARIPTANPSDLEYWGNKLYYDLTHRQRAMTVNVHGYIMPQGYRLGGGTVIGWQASQNGNQEQAQMTII